MLLHTILHDVEEAETVAAGTMTVADFFATYAAHFDLIFFDFKNVLVPVDRGLDDLRGFPWDAARHIFVGRKCSLLRDIRRAFGLRAGCKMHGVLGNWLMGFDIWSVRATEIRSVQFQLNRVADVPLLTWTLAAQRDVPTLCHLNPAWVLVDTMSSAPTAQRQRKQAAPFQEGTHRSRRLRFTARDRDHRRPTRSIDDEAHWTLVVIVDILRRGGHA